MDKRSKNMAKRILAALLSVMLVSGTAVMTPAYKNISRGIVVNAVEPSQGFEFSAATVTFTMNGEELFIGEGNEIHIAANATNVQPEVTVKDGEHTLTNEEFEVEFEAESDDWTTPGSEISVNVSGKGTYGDIVPVGVQFTIIIDLEIGNLYDGEVNIADLKAGDILKKGTILSNEYATANTAQDSYVTTPTIILLGGRYMGEDDTETAEEPYSTLDRDDFLSWSDSISVDEESAALTLPMYIHVEGSAPREEKSIFYPINLTKDDGEEPGDAWQVVSNENGVLVLQGITTPVELSGENITVGAIEPQKYTGSEVKPAITVYDGEAELVYGQDYTVSYENNVYAGTAIATIEGKNYYCGTKKVSFYIMPEFDLSAVIGEDSRFNVTVVKADGETTVTPDANGKVYLEPGDRIISDVDLEFVSAGNVPTRDEDDDAYYYRISRASGKADTAKKYNQITVRHTDTWAVNKDKDYPDVDDDNKDARYYYLMCAGEKGVTNEWLLQMTIDRASGVYNYGEHILIEIKKNLANSWGIKEEDLVVEPVKYAPVGQTEGEGILTDMGEYQASVIVYVKQINTNVTLRHNYSVAQKDITELGYTFSIDGKIAKSQDVNPGDNYKEEEVEVASDTTYAHSATHTPSVVLYNWVYNYELGEDGKEIGYEKVALVEDTDYTIKYVPYKVGNIVQGYTVTVTGKEGSNYKGTKTFKWDIDKQNAKPGFTDEAVSFVYNAGNTVDTSAFGLKVTADDPTETDADNVYTLVENTDYTVAYSYTDAEGRAVEGVPSNVGTYTVTANFTAANFVIDSISKEFTITRKEVTVTPQTAEITYGDATPVVAYTLGGVVEGGETVAATGLVVIDGTENTRTGVLDVKRNTQNEVIAYDYKFDTDSDNASVVADGDNFNYGRNYKLVLVTSGEGGVKYNFTVNPKAITENMFAFAATEFTYNRTEQSVNVTGTDYIGETNFMNGTADYTLSGDLSATDANRIVAGKENGYVVSAAGKGNYTGELTLTQTWKINPKSIAKPEDETTPDDINAWSTNSPATYNKQAQEPEVTVKDGQATLVEETEFVVCEHDDFINAGTYTFQVEGVGNYKDTRDVTFVIGPVESEDIELKIIGESSPIYDGETIVYEYDAVATDVDEGEYSFDFAWFDAQGNKIKADDDEDVMVVNAGTYKLVVTATGSQNYEDKEAEKTITIEKRHTDLYPDENQSIEYGEDTDNIVIKYDFEKAEGNRGVVAADIGEDGKDTVDFSPALAVDFGDDEADPHSVGTYYIYVVDNEELFDNYIVDDLDYSPEFQITPKQITRDMFTLTLDNGVTTPKTTAGADYDENNVPSVVFSNQKVTAAITSDKLATPADYRVSGTTAVYVSSVDFENNYKTEIYGRGNYAGYVDFEWAVTKAEKEAVITVPAETVYNRANPQPVEATVAMAEGTMPSDAVVTLTYWKRNKDNTYTQLESAPVNAGSYKVTAEITSRNYKIGAEDKYFHISRELVDEDVSINPNVVTAFDFGVASVGVDGVDVVLDGVTKLEKGVDYELAGTTETNVPGEYTVQVIGIGDDYFGTAVARWTLTEEGEDKDAAIADIEAKVKVDFARDGKDVDVDGQFLNGRKNVILGLNVTGADGETYKVLKKGIVYFNGEGEPVELTENSKAASKKGTSYLVTDIGNGIYARAYAVVAKVVSTDAYGNNGYQTTLYSDVYHTNFVDAIKYLTTVKGGTVVGTSAGRAVEILDAEGNGTGVYEVVYHGYDMADSAKSIKVSAPEVIEHEDAEDDKFRGWYADGKLVSMYPEYSFKVVNREKNLVAVYVPESEAVAVEPVITVSAVQGEDTKGRDAIKFIAQYEVPATDELPLETGILVATNASLGRTDVNADFDLLAATYTEDEMKDMLIEKGSKVSSTGNKITANYGTQTANLRADTDKTRYGYAIGYVVRADGTTVYSKVISASYNLAN